MMPTSNNWVEPVLIDIALGISILCIGFSIYVFYKMKKSKDGIWRP